MTGSVNGVQRGITAFIIKKMCVWTISISVTSLVIFHVFSSLTYFHALIFINNCNKCLKTIITNDVTYSSIYTMYIMYATLVFSIFVFLHGVLERVKE